MAQRTWFAPARPSRPEGLLARYRPEELSGAARWFVAQFTKPGDLVLDLFCQGPGLVRETVRAGRRAVGVNANPLSLLAAGLGLEPPPDPTALSAAFTRLADSPKGDVPLHHHLAGLYRTRCPACESEGTAVWFAWDREPSYPCAKAVRCLRCGEVQEGPTNEADIAAAGRLKPKGLAFHYALNRAAPAGHPAHERAAELVSLYTPRNLSALMDVTIRLEGLELDRRTRAALQGALVEAFDRGCGLDPHGEARARPRTLRHPVCFLERNVWYLLEESVARLQAQPAVERPTAERAPDLSALLAARSPAYILTPSAGRDVGEILPARAFALILADPLRPDGVFWALCALWASWLWDLPAARALRPFLGRRRFEWEWHQSALRTAFAAASSVLQPSGHLVTLFKESDGELLESVCLAASGAGYDLLGWGTDAEIGCHLVWQARRGPPAGAEDPSATRERFRDEGTGVAPTDEEPGELVRAATELARRCLEERGEPTPRTVLRAAVCAGLVATDGHAHRPVEQAVKRALERLTPETAGESELLWAPHLDGKGLEPLGDRVEAAVWELFRSRLSWSEEALLRWVYARFSGPLTVDPSLVRACLESYGLWQEESWRMREEDALQRRRDELKVLCDDLQALAKRLGFQVAHGQGWQVRWQEGGRDLYLFALSPTAALGRFLLAGPPVPEGGRPCLVFPGGRAELLAHRLQRDPRLARAVEEKGWEFIKFRHVRRLVAEALDRRVFEAVLSLDPVVEREDVQIPLMLGGDS